MRLIILKRGEQRPYFSWRSHTNLEVNKSKTKPIIIMSVCHTCPVGGLWLVMARPCWLHYVLVTLRTCYITYLLHYVVITLRTCPRSGGRTNGLHMTEGKFCCREGIFFKYLVFSEIMVLLAIYCLKTAQKMPSQTSTGRGIPYSPWVWFWLFCLVRLSCWWQMNVPHIFIYPGSDNFPTLHQRFTKLNSQQFTKVIQE